MIDKIVSTNLSHLIDSFNKGLLQGLSILITGGAGFIGSWLADLMVKLGAHVTVLDNMLTGKKSNIDHLFAYNNFKLIVGDVKEVELHEKYDYIAHIASIPAPDMYTKKPIETLLINSLGSLKVLELARKHDSKILLTSTSEVYGDAKIMPTPESYWGYVSPIGPRSCYDEGKRFAEALFMAYYTEYGVDVRIARIFNTYGPRLDPNVEYARVIPKFIMQALTGNPITIYGDGKQTRTFCYITDTINALLKMLIEEKCKGEVINVGSQHEINILELAETIKNLIGSKSKIIFLPPRPNDPKRRCPDISKAMKLLNWKPKISLEEGINYTINWFKNQPFNEKE